MVPVRMSAARIVGLVAGLAACTAEAPDPSLASVRGALKVCPAGDTVPGVDVSAWQGAIDWEAVASSGVVFAIARAAHGTSADSTFAGHWSAIRAHGMVRGAYLFYEPQKDTAAQAQIVVAAVGMLGPGDLPVTIDAEWNDYGDPNPTDLGLLIDLIEQGTGKRPMIYTSAGYWLTKYGDVSDLDLWVANWNATCPLMPAGWTGWEFWQTTGGGGNVPGISGGVDTDVFNGTAADLAVVAGQPAGTGCSMREALACHRVGKGCADAVCLDPLPPDAGPADSGPDAADATGPETAAPDPGAEVPPPDEGGTTTDAPSPAEVAGDPGAPASDAGPVDPASPDAVAPDASDRDAAAPDAGAPDTIAPDAGAVADTASPDADPAPPATGGGCTAGPAPASAVPLLVLLLAPLPLAALAHPRRRRLRPDQLPLR